MNPLYLDLFNKIDFKNVIDHPNILIAAAFWEEDRYQAARTCYKFMRAIDDLIDYHKTEHTTIAESEKAQFMDQIQSWLAMARNSGNSNGPHKELMETIHRFHIPIWPLEAFAKSMIYDIDHNGFATLSDYLEYTQGASVAPASIFVHLNGLIKKGDEFFPPAFDVKSAATPCAVFSYLVHIVRDFQKDQLSNLNYFADDLLTENGLTTSDLRKIAEGAPIPQGFRNMIKTYLKLADEYRRQTYEVIKQISPLLDARYRLSLMIIFNLYLMVFERIDPDTSNFTGKELNPTPEEIRDRVYETIEKFEE
jgi:phytoene/squalene synthetase